MSHVQRVLTRPWAESVTRALLTQSSIQPRVHAFVSPDTTQPVEHVRSVLRGSSQLPATIVVLVAQSTLRVRLTIVVVTAPLVTLEATKSVLSAKQQASTPPVALRSAAHVQFTLVPTLIIHRVFAILAIMVTVSSVRRAESTRRLSWVPPLQLLTVHA